MSSHLSTLCFKNPHWRISNMSIACHQTNWGHARNNREC